MVHLIDKDTLVAEIERIKNTEYNENSISNDVACCALDMVIDTIDTLEVKEVDLEKAAFDNAQKNYKEGFRGAAMQAFNEGADWRIAQMMAKAVDATVHIDAGGYPYIPQMELYNYEKDIPLAREGDKYKVVLIRED